MFVRRVETEQFRREVPVDGERRACQRASTERVRIGQRVSGLQPLLVPEEHTYVGSRPKTETNRLRMLRVRIPRHNGIKMILCNFEKRIAECRQATLNVQNLLPNIEVRVNKHLVIPRTRGVEFPTEFAPRILDEIRLNVHVNVLFIRIKRQLTVSEILCRFLQPA